jgi:hypothetical protein
MRDFRGQHVSRLAKETLAEVPRQLVSFAKQQRIIVYHSLSLEHISFLHS